MTAEDRLIIALDFTTLAPALRMARRLRGLVRTVKVGSVLFTACGPEAIRRLRALGLRVMLDVKLWDIPSTVELSCRAAASHGVSLLTVHAAGEPEMLKAAVRGVREEAARRRITRPLVLGVTVLTSHSPSHARGGLAGVLRLAAGAVRAGCDGVVASAHEAAALRQRFGKRLRIVCPGIRLAGTDAGDQRRIATPDDAVASGADYLVVGRPITGSRRPRATTGEILRAIEEGARRC